MQRGITAAQLTEPMELISQQIIKFTLLKGIFQTQLLNVIDRKTLNYWLHERHTYRATIKKLLSQPLEVGGLITLHACIAKQSTCNPIVQAILCLYRRFLHTITTWVTI